MMNILISPIKKAKWKIPLERYIDFLKGIYPGITITQIEDDNRNYIYEWQYMDDNFYLNGQISRDLNCVIFETNNMSKCHDFILGTRKFMPKEEKIIIYDEDFVRDIILTENN